MGGSELPRQIRSSAATPAGGTALSRRDRGPRARPARAPAGAHPSPGGDTVVGEQPAFGIRTPTGIHLPTEAHLPTGAHALRPDHDPGLRRRARYRLGIRLVAALWSLLFMALVLLPQALAFVSGGQRRPWSRGGIWIELGMTSGLLGLSTLAATVVLRSRLRSLSRVLGVQLTFRSHRWLAVVTALVVVAHATFIVIDHPQNVMLLLPGPGGANRGRAGLVAGTAVILLCLLAFRRRRLGTRYDVWRWLHVMLAVTALVATALHVYWHNHLLQDRLERTVLLSIGGGVALVLVNRWIRRPLAAWRHPYRVARVHRETPTITRLVLTPARRRQRPLRFRPGQFVWLRLDSPFGPMQGNPFTIATGAGDPRGIEFTIRHVGDFTTVAAGLHPGRKVYLDGPYGSFNDEGVRASSLLLIAGGVGMAPMMSLLRSNALRGDRRPHCLVMAARSTDELMFREELRELSEYLDLEVVEVLADPPPHWEGLSGRLDDSLISAIISVHELHDAHVFICGPPLLVDTVESAAAAAGVPPGRVRAQRYDLV